MHGAWLQSDEPVPDKDVRFLERIFAEPVTSIDWALLLRDCRAKQHPDLPHSATDWIDPFDVLREADHPEIFRLFDRLLSVIGSSGGRDLSFVAWGAMEEAVRRNEPERL